MPTTDMSDGALARVQPCCKHDNDWHSDEQVRDWRARDAGRAAERDRWLSRLTGAVPFARDDVLCVLDVGGGYGAVSARVLEAFPGAEVTLHDYSDVMLRAARETLAGFGERVRYARADLHDPAWTEQVGGRYDLVVSALCIHNTRDMAVIARCYADMRELLRPGGCFLDYDHFDHIGSLQIHLDLFGRSGYARVEPLHYEPPTAIIRAWG